MICDSDDLVQKRKEKVRMHLLTTRIICLHKMTIHATEELFQLLNITLKIVIRSLKQSTFYVLILNIRKFHRLIKFTEIQSFLI